MLLTRCVDYGIRGILHIARKEEGETVLLGDVAEAEKIPKSFLAKIMQTLAKANILKSSRGLNGGFSMARPASEINLREVVEVLNGPISLVECQETGRFCEFVQECNVHPVWNRIQKALIRELESVTLDQFIGEAGVALRCAKTEEEIKEAELNRAAAI